MSYRCWRRGDTQQSHPLRSWTPAFGIQSVIGAPRVVDDDVAKHIVEAFYENMFKDFKDSGVRLYEGCLGTQPCYKRREDKSAA